MRGDQFQAVQHVGILGLVVLEKLLVIAETGAPFAFVEEREEARGDIAHRHQDAVQFLGGEALAPRDGADVAP